mmetsp:Transcript_84224/g.146255  ORF Transcript_84224/g.146255 Transcript_84224/m.146255 type:complete len:589 (+) Transcript_84224:51-1817(+)
MVSVALALGGVGAAAAGVAGLVADVDASSGDLIFMEPPRRTSAGKAFWNVVATDRWFEVQEYAMGGVGTLIRNIKKPMTQEVVKDFRLLLKLGSDCLELAVAPDALPLQRIQWLLLRVARAAELGAFDCTTYQQTVLHASTFHQTIPEVTILAVIAEANRRAFVAALADASRGASELMRPSPGKQSFLLRYDLQLNLFAYLAESDLTKAATVCTYWAVASGDDLLWEPHLVNLNREKRLVDDRVLFTLLGSRMLKGTLSAKDIFLLTLIETHRVIIEATKGVAVRRPPALRSVARGLYGLGAELKDGSHGCLVAAGGGGFYGGYFGGCAGAAGGAAVGSLLCAPLGGAAGLVSGACRGRRDTANLCRDVTISAQTAGMAGAASGACVVGGASGCVGGVAGAAVGTAIGGVRFLEGVGKGTAELAGNAATALRRAPDVTFGTWTSEHDDGVSGVHNHERGITWGVVLGLGALGSDCATAAAGIVSEPLRGARDRQLPGALKGLGRALLGMFARPTAGLLDVAGGAMRGTGNRLQQVREGTICCEIRDEVSEGVKATSHCMASTTKTCHAAASECSSTRADDSQLSVTSI